MLDRRCALSERAVGVVVWVPWYLAPQLHMQTVLGTCPSLWLRRWASARVRLIDLHALLSQSVLSECLSSPSDLFDTSPIVRWQGMSLCNILLVPIINIRLELFERESWSNTT